MATVRDSDTSLWLHNKLGTSNDSWAGGSICSQLNPEVLKHIQECFVDLQTQVKLKLLLSYFQLSRRNLEEWRTELEEILEVALVDSDPWVSMIAEILKTYPSTGALNTDIGSATDEDNRRIFNDLMADLRKLVWKHGDSTMLPLECPYLNKTALYTVVGQQPQPPKHFTLKRKPKSAALRAELLQKSSDAQTNLKKHPAPTVPLRSRGVPRKMTDTTPLKGIPSRPALGFASSLNRTPTTAPTAALGTSPSVGGTPVRPSPRSLAGRKDGGIKLLDITEQPMGFAQAKKRKRQQELEAAQKAAAEAQPGVSSAEGAGASATNPAAPSEEAATPTETAEKPAPTPDYAAGLLPSNPPPTPAPAANPITQLAPLKEPNLARVVVLNQPGIRPPSSTPAPAPQVVRFVTAPGTVAPAIHTPTVIRVVQPGAAPGVTANAPQQQPQRKSVALTLTREQMQEAQEMFKNANKVTRPEKALILGFMAGSRENPCPHLGNIVTIKLSEDEEMLQQPDGTTTRMIVETHFQMNYQAGEWKRIKKYRKMDDISSQA
nr:EOG090X08WB [Eulimnadia texana]